MVKKLIPAFAALAVLWLSPTLVCQGDTITTCTPFQNVTVGPYVVQTDFWNQAHCPGTQCVDIDDETGAFTVTQNTPVCPDVSSYPSVVYGKAWGLNTAQTALPALLNSLQSVTSSWDFTPTYTGSWDAAYDIWVCPDNSCGSSGFSGGAELMIWMDYYNTSGWKIDMGPVTLSGKTWEIWQTDMGEGANKWKYIAYLSQTPVTAVNNLDINSFLKDSTARGYLQPDWYLYAVEAGNEMRKDGVPFASHSFSVAVNKGGETPAAYGDTAHPGMPLVSRPAASYDLVIQNFLTRNPKAGTPFADAIGSTLTYQVKDNPNQPGTKFLAIHFDEKPGGYCGVSFPTETQDWTGGKAVRFLVYSKVPVVMSLVFKDKNNNQYTADAPSTKGTGWETIQIPMDSFKLDTDYTSPDAVKGAALDLTSVKSFNLQPKTPVKTTVGINGLMVAK